MLADPDRSDSTGKTMFAITKVPAFFDLFPHVFPPALNNAPRRYVGCIDRRTEIAEPILVLLVLLVVRRLHQFIWFN
jgi:hypothetical protein